MGSGGKKMFCRNCGKEISNDSVYCHDCGAKVESIPLSGAEPQVTPDDKDTFDGEVNQADYVPQHEAGSNSSYGAKQTPRHEATPPNPYAAYNAVMKKRVTPRKAFYIAFFVTIGLFIIFIAIGAIIERNENADAAGLVVNTDEKDNTVYDYKYSYNELRGVVSLDSDARFVYSFDYFEEDVTVYTFLFNDKNATEAAFNQACDDYALLLQEVSGFTYETEYTEQRYSETGVFVDYLTRGRHGLSISGSYENSLYYAHISIFHLSKIKDVSAGQQDIGADTRDISAGQQDMGAETQNDGTNTQLNMPNYNTYLADREIKGFSYDETVNMDNGLSFVLYDVISNWHSDGTMTVDITLDLSSYYMDYYMNNGDFMVLPLDGNDKVLADSQPIAYILDDTENIVEMPFLVSASSYIRYTFTYFVPPETKKFFIFATNATNEDLTKPVYVMSVGF
jgi:hypothetical protein